MYDKCMYVKREYWIEETDSYNLLFANNLILSHGIHSITNETVTIPEMT